MNKTSTLRVCVVAAACLPLAGCFTWSDQEPQDMMDVRNDTNLQLGVQWQGRSPDYELDPGDGARIVRNCKRNTLVVSRPDGEEFARLTDEDLCRATLVVVHGQDDMTIEERE